MPVSVDWGTKVIHVPKDYLTFVSGTTYQMNVDDFRLRLKDLEDDYDGMPFLDTHRHIPPVTLSGATYSRFVEIINGYTVTFEDGLYQVNLSGANNNIVDVLNRNSVSVVANNSSGLISSDQLEFSAYQNRVTIDTVNGVSSTTYPAGTVSNPVNNIVDALAIAQETGITQLYFKNDYTIPSYANVAGLELVGEAPSRTTLTFQDGATTDQAEIANCRVQGFISNVAEISNCYILDLTETSDAVDAEITIKDSIFEGTLTMSSGLSGEVQLYNCKTGISSSTTPVLDFNDSSANILVRDYTGTLELQNMIAGNKGTLDFLSGQVIFDSSNTNADVVVRGLASISNNAEANPGFILTDEVSVTAEDVEEIASAVWDKLTAQHVLEGSFGQKVGKKLLTTSKFIGLK